jgi:hypothetical protein
MRLSFQRTIFYFIFLLCSACSKGNSGDGIDLLFDSTPVVHPLTPIINEISGIADSKLNPGYIWAEEDGGNLPQLYLISHLGKLNKTIFLKDAVNRDWEEMQLSAGKIYIGDIGDNNRVYEEYHFYCFNEPSVSIDTIALFDKIRFKYSDGPHDAEAFLIDPQTRDIIIITKRDNPSLLFKISFPYSTTGLNIATPVGSLSISGVVGAALSPNSDEILIKTYFSIARFGRKQGESIAQALQSASTIIAGYKAEPQGEAIGFSLDNKGFFTLSEKGFASSVNLYYYRRK